MNTNFKSTSKSCLQSYILSSLTGLRATLLPLGGRRGWGRVCFFLLSLLLFAACSSDNDEQVQQPQPEKSYPLTIEVTENPMTGDGENSSNRAAITTTSGLAEFCMDYVYNTSTHGNQVASIDPAGTWSADSWPSDAAYSDCNVDWYAHTSYTKSGSDFTSAFYLTGDHRPYIAFSVVEDVAQQKDLLVATTSGTWSGTNGNLSFTFDHACSALRFWVKKATNLNDYTLSISRIVLKNVVKVGNYFFKTSSWELGATSTEYTLYSGSATTLGHADYIPMDGGTPSYLFFIPQTLAPWNPAGALGNTYLEITCTIYKGSDKVFPAGEGNGTAYMPFGTSFLAGQKYDIMINIGKNSLYSGPGTKIIP